MLFVLMLLAIYILAPVQAQTPCTTAGILQRDSYTSVLLGQTMTYSIYLPPCYDTSQTYPTLYLMHGSNEDDQQWQRLNLHTHLDEGIHQGIYPPIIVVMPFGNVIANRNRFDAISWGNIFMTEFLPHVQSRYPVSTDRRQRAIGGISRGGFWAYHVGLLHPDQFATIGGHSAFFDLYATPPEVNPLHLALSQTLPSDMRLWLDRGADDFAWQGLDQMHERLTQAEIDHTYNIHPTGEHNALYWREHLTTYLDFYTASWHETDTPSIISPTPTPVRPNIQSPTFGQPTPGALTDSAQQGGATTPAGRLYLPLVATQSLRTHLTFPQLESLLNGDHDPHLIVTPAVYDDLLARGIVLSPQTRIISDDALIATLRRDRIQPIYTLAPFDALPEQTRTLLLGEQSIFTQLADYGFYLPDAQPANFDPDKLTRITLSGVTALTRNTRLALQETPIETAVSGIAPYVHTADFFHISNEVSFVDDCPHAPGLPRLGGSHSFCAEWEHAPLLDALGVDIIELTGNHNNDYGYDAYQSTLEYYHENGFMTVGGGLTPQQAQQPLLIDHNGNRIAWLACNAIGPYYALVNDDPNLAGGIRGGAAFCDWTWLAQTIPQQASQADVVIVTVQHEEFETYLPTDQQRFDFRHLADWGADVVIGTAPHKPQIFDWYTAPTHRAFLHYGLGNLYFDQPFWGNRRFFMDTLIIYDAQLITLELFVGIIDDNVRPRPMTDDERFNFMFFLLVDQNQ